MVRPTAPDGFEIDHEFVKASKRLKVTKQRGSDRPGAA
jgi:hypothetical protein